jgi:catechol 2,3-dioxygenase-like lactoylglutathione lyase family enzyme
MPDALRWLTLEVKYLAPAREFYAETLDVGVVVDGDAELRFDAGEHELRLRRPSGAPRGGLHTHFAFATPDHRYDDWWDHLSAQFDLEEHRFGDARSLYCYDPDGNCVEIGERGGGNAPITGIFEIVLEVEDLAAAESFYADLGFDSVDRGERRKRVRMTGPVDLELWEPHLGLADARGGVHVGVGFADPDPVAAVAPVVDRVTDRVQLDDGVRVRDPDGHWLTVTRRS